MAKYGIGNDDTQQKRWWLKWADKKSNGTIKFILLKDFVKINFIGSFWCKARERESVVWRLLLLTQTMFSKRRQSPLVLCVSFGQRKKPQRSRINARNNSPGTGTNTGTRD